MPSTTYAATRLFLEAGETDTLMRMLDDRLNYGMFPDTPTLAMILNHFLVKENWYYLTQSLADCWKFGEFQIQLRAFAGEMRLRRLSRWPCKRRAPSLIIPLPPRWLSTVYISTQCSLKRQKRGSHGNQQVSDFLPKLHHYMYSIHYSFAMNHSFRSRERFQRRR